VCSVRGTADGSTFSFLESLVWNDAVVAGVVGSRSLSATLTMDGAIPSGAAGASGLACLRFSHAARRWTQGSKWTGWENLFQENNQGFSVGAGLLVGHHPVLVAGVGTGRSPPASGLPLLTRLKGCPNSPGDH
jgi:hypothetical protein